MEKTKELMWQAWWVSSLQVVSFHPADKDYERRRFEQWYTTLNLIE